MRRKLITIRDVAERAGVSMSTVSHVLNRNDHHVSAARREMILAAVEELGYRPNTVARNLATRRAGAIGIVCNIATDPDSLDMAFLAAILTTVSEMGRRVMLIPADDQQIQEVALDHAVDGMVFLDERVSDPRIADLLEMGMPAGGLWSNHLAAALYQGGEELALHLESRGHQRVICMCGPSDELFVAKFKRMVADTLQAYGIALTFYHCPPNTEAEIAQSIAHEAREQRATAIIASSDKLAINAIRGLHLARLRVPEDCAVTGFGDVSAAQWVQPPLTTIRVPVSAVARWAVSQVLSDGLLDDRQAMNGVASGRLIVRRSC